MKIAGKALIAGLACLLLTNALFAAPKKKQTKEEKALYKELSNQFSKAGYVIQKDPKTKKAYDFGGEKIIVADWWSNPNGLLTTEPRSPYEEELYRFRRYVNNEYNMNVDQYGLPSGWGSHPQTVANFCTTGGDENYVFIIDGRSISAGLKRKLFWNLLELEGVDWKSDKWLPGVTEKMTIGNAVYGCTPTKHAEPKTGMFFNKRLLKEANIDPDSIYDMQKNGTWTWETFEKMLIATTRDIDNDGVLDVFGMANVSDQFCGAAVMSNGACYIAKNKDGKFENHLGDEATLEALGWASRMMQAYEMPYPEGANWDWWYAAFKNGQTCFMVNGEYYANQNSDMIDDWGFVCFPAGPRGDGKYRCGQDENTFVIPGCYDKARAEKIAKMFDLWSDSLPGYPDDFWKEDFYPHFRDSRAVDETLVFMNDNGKTDYSTLVSGLNYGFLPNVYGGWQTPQEAYEEYRNQWDAMIKEQNR